MSNVMDRNRSIWADPPHPRDVRRCARTEGDGGGQERKLRVGPAAVPDGAVLRPRGDRRSVPDGAPGARPLLPSLREQSGDKARPVPEIPPAPPLQGLRQDVQRQDGYHPALPAHLAGKLDAGPLGVPVRAAQRGVHQLHRRVDRVYLPVHLQVVPGIVRQVVPVCPQPPPLRRRRKVPGGAGCDPGPIPGWDSRIYHPQMGRNPPINK